MKVSAAWAEQMCVWYSGLQHHPHCRPVREGYAECVSRGTGCMPGRKWTPAFPSWWMTLGGHNSQLRNCSNVFWVQGWHRTRPQIRKPQLAPLCLTRIWPQKSAREAKYVTYQNLSCLWVGYLEYISKKSGLRELEVPYVRKEASTEILGLIPSPFLASSFR